MHGLDKIDAADELLIDNVARHIDVGLGPVGGKTFGEGTGMPVNMAHRGCQPRKIRHRVGPDLVPYCVDPGNLDIAHGAEEIAFALDEMKFLLLVVDMELVFHVVLRAPDGLRLEES